ncbi:MAG: hypothetical protein JWP78_3711 [Mucilaginibacter sp.]|nr:hypothetical protein [Mucilaginibacter sp.]
MITMNLNRYFTVLAASLALFYNQPAMAQSPGFVQQDVIKQAGITTDAQLYALGVSGRQTTRVYYDGLSRPLQTVALQGSPLYNDIIQPIAYDNLGRQTKSYLPYVGLSTDTMGSYRLNALPTAQASFYNQSSQHLIATDLSPYSSQLFDNSPLQRLLQTIMPGNVDMGKMVSYRYNSTTSDGNILVWKPDGTFTAGTYYGDNMLSVTDGKDEDNTETLSFADVAGQTILKRQILPGGNLDTYYIYNSAGMISYIVPPLAIAKLPGVSYSLTAVPVSNLVFHFVYDTRGRLIEKTVPAKGKVSIVYDPLNRPVLLQDANMLVNNQWNYIRYDAKGRAISQGIYTDSNSGRLGRVNMQAYVSTLSYASWYESRTATLTNNGYYTCNIFPTLATGTITPLAYSYYDDYDMNFDGTPDFVYSLQSLAGEMGATTAQIKNMPTITSKTTVGSGLSNVWLTTAVFYDKRGNLIQSQSNNQLYYTNAGTVTDYKTNVPDFSGVPQISKVSKKTTASTTTTVLTLFTYDHMYRLTAVNQQYNTSGATLPVATYQYNELGQLVKKNLQPSNNTSIPANIALGPANSVTATSTTTITASNSITMSPGADGSPFLIPTGANYQASIASLALQTLDYRYNIRGQLLSINNSKLSNDGGVTNSDGNDLFGMQMLYDKVDASLGNTACYSGKLSAVKWISKDGSSVSSFERAYKYSYDALNRDTAAIYAERATAGTGSFTTTHGWDEDRITYDQNGNLLTMYRNSSTQGSGTHAAIDNLTYTYDTNNPNQLKSVADASGSSQGFTGGTGTYNYDGNGNLTNEPYKGISTIAYNVLNRTDKISFTSSANKYLDYTYDAGGTLIRKRQYDTVRSVLTLITTTDYLDGFVYTTAGTGTPALAYFAMPEGRVLNNTGTLSQEYDITDQQGNVRIAFDNTGTGGTAKVRQENSYYAFGMIMPGSTVATPGNPNKNLYNGGSEWQNDYGNMPDYQQTFFRNYDAALGRWIGADPEAESTESVTGYQYAGNNPIMFNDPLGNKPDPYGFGGGSNWTAQAMSELITGEQAYMNAYRGFVDGTGNSGGFFFGSGTADYSSFWASILAHYTGNVKTDGPLTNIMKDVSAVISTVSEFRNSIELPEVKINAFRSGNLPIWWGDSQRFVGANQGGSSSISDALNWMGNHFYTEVSGRLTQGAIGFTSGRFAGSEIDLGKHNLATLTTGTDKGGINAYKDDGTKIYGGQLVVPVEGIPIGIGATHDANSGQNSGIFGIGAFGYERTGNSNFIGLDMTSGVNLYFLGIEGTAKIGFKW